MYKVGDKIAHPMHGAGIVQDIIERKIDGVSREYYLLSLPVGGMDVMVPTEHASEVGIRPIIDEAEAADVMDAFPDMEVDTTQNWNRRYRENMDRLKSGDLVEVARVMKGLMMRDYKKKLSSGEQKMLRSAKQIFYSEIVLSQACTYEEVEKRIDLALH